MAKRANPFIEDYVQQSKIHVSLKQFNNNEDRLQKVYEKTLELLFKGAKKSQPQEVVIPTDNDNMRSTDKRDKMKQLFIGKNLILSHSGNMVCNKLSVKQCTCGGAGESQCAYCELSLCFACQHQCIHCEKAYCKTCTLTGLEGSEVCVSCYS